MSPPAPRAGKLFRRILRVIDKNIRAFGQFAQTFIQFGIARFVVRRVSHRPRRGFDSEAQAALRVVQPARGDLVFPDGERVSARDLFEFSFRVHRRQIHGEIRQRHLRFKDLLQAVAPENFRAETIELKFIVFGVKRREERNPLNVIPVIMRDENVRLRAGAGAGSCPAAAQHAQSRAAVEYELRPVRCNELEARRISAESPRGWIHGGRRTAHAPKTQFGDRTCHFPRLMSIARKSCPEKERARKLT